jgi:hypothetical protein
MIDSKVAIEALKEIEEELTEALVGLQRDNVMVSVYNRRIDAIDTAIQAISAVNCIVG